MTGSYYCLLCSRSVSEPDIPFHKAEHGDLARYGIMWPPKEQVADSYCRSIPTYESEILTQVLGVKRVYIRDEGANFSGSMKDYSVRRAIRLGLHAGKTAFYVVSSGNHACSLAIHAKKRGVRAVVFTLADCSKMEFLSSLPNTLVVGIKASIFEEAYNFVNRAYLDDNHNLYNANVNNERLLPAFAPIAEDIMSLDPPATHVLAGVGNGSYLAGIGLGFEYLKPDQSPRIVPVGMKGAFPSQEAFRRGQWLHEYTEFAVPESEIDAAEGSIATESYSMPQLMRALRLTHGFTLGGLTNLDLRNAYYLLARDDNLVSHGAIPEPTGIMSLAAALKWKRRFTKNDVLLLSFTGHGAKDWQGIERLVPTMGNTLASVAKVNRPDLVSINSSENQNSVLLVEKDASPEFLRDLVMSCV
jgi:threonine synthase